MPDPATASPKPAALIHTLQQLRDARAVVVLSGAGMSAESGIATFRGSHGSLWSEFDPVQLANADAWRADPALVWGWYLWRMAQVRRAEPHAGYHALASLQQRLPNMRIVTQNVDDLHERAGLRDVIHLHGELFAHRCFTCALPHGEIEIPDALTNSATLRVEPPRCTHCGGQIRPGVVWFGEFLSSEVWVEAETLARGCEVMLVVGTSGVVYPATALPGIAKAMGATIIEINPEETVLSATADLHLRMTAAAGLAACLESARSAE